MSAMWLLTCLIFDLFAVSLLLLLSAVFSLCTMLCRSRPGTNAVAAETAMVPAQQQQQLSGGCQIAHRQSFNFSFSTSMVGGRVQLVVVLCLYIISYTYNKTSLLSFNFLHAEKFGAFDVFVITFRRMYECSQRCFS